MKHRVHLYPTMLVSVDVDIPGGKSDHTTAVEAALKIVDENRTLTRLAEAAVDCLGLAKEVVVFDDAEELLTAMVDDDGDEEHENTRTYVLGNDANGKLKLAPEDHGKPRVSCCICDAGLKACTIHDFKMDDLRTPIEWVFCPNCTVIYGIRMLAHALIPVQVKRFWELAGGMTFMTHDDFYTKEGLAIQPNWPRNVGITGMTGAQGHA